MNPLQELLRRPIAFHRVFVDIAGSVNAALFLSQACYWSTTKDWDWFYKTQQDWQFETGLSRHEQDAARRRLVKIGVLEEVRKGVPAQMFYRVKVDNLANLIAEIRQSGSTTYRQSSSPESGNLYKEAESTTESTSKTTKQADLPEWIPVEPWSAWVDMRKKMRNAPFTERAQILAIKELIKLRDAGEDPAAVLNQAVMRGYRGLFPVSNSKGNNANKTQQHGPNGSWTNF